MFGATEGRTMSESSDDAANTILVVEAPSDKSVHWMQPVDLDLDDVLAFDPESTTGHPGGFMAVYVDGHVDFIDHRIDRQALRDMLATARKEEPGD
jgi:prepilin-type processing-associated H-X9-DG protein